MFGPLVALLTMLLVVVAWCFFNYPPRFADKKQVAVFNWTIVFFILILCVPYCFYIDEIMPPIRRAQFLKYFMVGGCELIAIATLTLSFLLRNFWVFKGKRNNYY